MEELDYWRLCDELTVVQAALLLADIAPSREFHYVMNWEEHDRPENFSATLAALSHAVLGGRIPATLYTFYASILDEATGTQVRHDTGELDWQKTTILVEDLKTWLRSRGVFTGFFFPHYDETPAYLQPYHPSYAPKLAAAIGAWQAVNSDPGLLKGKTVKQAMITWLKGNAEQLELIKDDGSLNKKGVEEAATVANWDEKGGAPKTPV